MKKFGKFLEKAAKDVGGTVTKFSTSELRQEGGEIEKNIEGQLKSLTLRVESHVQKWDAYLQAKPDTIDKEEIQQQCSGFKSELESTSKIFSCEVGEGQQPTALKQINWLIHEADKNGSSVSQCETWLSSVKAQRDQFLTKQSELIAKLEASDVALTKRQAIDLKVAELSKLMTESRSKWRALVDNPYKKMDKGAVEAALNAFDDKFTELTQASLTEFDALYSSLAGHVLNNIAAREKLEATIEEMKFVEEKAKQEQEINELAGSFLAADLSQKPPLVFSPMNKDAVEEVTSEAKSSPKLVLNHQ